MCTGGLNQTNVQLDKVYSIDAHEVRVKSKLTIYFVSAHCYFCVEQFIHASQSTKKNVLPS